MISQSFDRITTFCTPRTNMDRKCNEIAVHISTWFYWTINTNRGKSNRMHFARFWRGEVKKNLNNRDFSWSVSQKGKLHGIEIKLLCELYVCTRFVLCAKVKCDYCFLAFFLWPDVVCVFVALVLPSPPFLIYFCCYFRSSFAVIFQFEWMLNSIIIHKFVVVVVAHKPN